MTISRVNREIDTAKKAKTNTENKLKNLSNKPKAGLLLDLAEKYLSRAQNNSNLYRRSADALVTRVLFSQASALR